MKTLNKSKLRGNLRGNSRKLRLELKFHCAGCMDHPVTIEDLPVETFDSIDRLSSVCRVYFPFDFQSVSCFLTRNGYPIADQFKVLTRQQLAC